MYKYSNAAAGLRKLLSAEILIIVGLVISFIPVLGTLIYLILAIVALIVEMIGLSEAGRDHYEYQEALGLVVANLVLSIVSAFIGLFLGQVISKILSLVSTVLSIIIVKKIVDATNVLLRIAGDYRNMNKGETVFKLYLIANILSATSSWTAILFARLFIRTLSGLTTFIVVYVVGLLVFTIVATAFYISYLSGSANTLGRYIGDNN